MGGGGCTAALGKVTTISCFQCFGYSSGHSARTWWVATSAVGSNIRGGQRHLWWAATFVVGSDFRGGQQHSLRAINLMVGSDAGVIP